MDINWTPFFNSGWREPPKPDGYLYRPDNKTRVRYSDGYQLIVGELCTGRLWPIWVIYNMVKSDNVASLLNIPEYSPSFMVA